MRGAHGRPATLPLMAGRLPTVSIFRDADRYDTTVTATSVIDAVRNAPRFFRSGPWQLGRGALGGSFATFPFVFFLSSGLIFSGAVIASSNRNGDRLILVMWRQV